MWYSGEEERIKSSKLKAQSSPPKALHLGGSLPADATHQALQAGATMPKGLWAEKLKIAIVHEYLIKRGGAERVLKQLLSIFKNASIFTLLYNEKGTARAFRKNKIVTSFLQHFPFAKSKYALYLPLMPSAIEQFDFRDYDLVLSNSHSFGKGIKTSDRTLHICYCHTPTRYLWLDTKSHIKRSGYHSPVKKIIPYMLTKLKKWDKKAAERPDYWLANSKNVQTRIKKFYHKNSAVLYPPVDTKFYHATMPKQNYFLYVSRLEPHKKPDLAVLAFNRLKFPLWVVGKGSLEEKLYEIAKPNIKFFGEISDQRLRDLYSGARALIFPQEEDFGIVPLEAMACETPVIAYNRGGARETVKEGQSGIFFDQNTPSSLIFAIQKFNRMKFNPKGIRAQAKKFDQSVFAKNVKSKVYQYYKEWRKKL